MKKTNKKLPKWLESKGELVILLLGWAILIGASLVLSGKSLKDIKEAESIRQNLSKTNLMYNDTINQHVR